MKNTVDFPGTVKMWIEDERIRFDLSHPDLLPKGARISGPHLDSKVGQALLKVMVLQRLHPLTEDGPISSITLDGEVVVLGGDWTGQLRLQRHGTHVEVSTEELYEDEVLTVAWSALSAIQALGWDDLSIVTAEQLAPYLRLAAHPDVTMNQHGRLNVAGASFMIYSQAHHAYLAKIYDTADLYGLLSVITAAWGDSPAKPGLIVDLAVGEPSHLMLQVVRRADVDVTLVSSGLIHSAQGTFRVSSHRNGDLIELTTIEVEGKKGQEPTPEETKFVLRSLQAAAEAIGVQRTYALALNSGQIYTRKLTDVLSRTQGKSPEEVAQALIQAGLINVGPLQEQEPKLQWNNSEAEEPGGLKRSW